ncbi:hypothetical protein [Geodermatophilus sp. DSM 44513]|uniref:hypothetical protein n=1 Tax=Geodermatophilus sp. DSM 44513 TaxID=1528104 RepID=UPI001273B237|nr:hypothetical protein [Geodermatophilus sp. DSM 44513]WNV75526.1 hypothetical protein RTG05_21510 [Geodermatophilus sp. DSM 44513]
MSVLLLLPVLAGVMALVVTGVVRRSPPSREAAVAGARAHARVGSAAAVLLGAAAGVWIGTTRLEHAAAPGSLGVTALLVPVTFGLVHTAVLAVAELTWPRPDGAVRRARLERRGLLDAAPRWLLRMAAVSAVAATTTVLAGSLVAAPDGRSLVVDDPPFEVTASPFAGPVYGTPAAVGLLLLAAATAGALWVVANRPAVATQDDRIEAALRVASAHRVLRGAVGASLTVSGGLLGVSGRALWTVGSSSGRELVALLGLLTAACGFTALLAAAVVLCTRAPRVPAGEQAVPA